MQLKVGDIMLVKDVLETGGPGKLRSYWERKVYEVKKVMGEGNVVYSVQAENEPRSRIRVVHRNMIMHCGELQRTEHVDDCEVKSTKHARTRRSAQSDGASYSGKCRDSER